MTVLAVGQARLTEAEAAIIETVAYSDVFDFPLTAEDIWRALPRPASLEEVRQLLASDAMARLLTCRPPYFMLRGREHLVAVRERRLQSSRTLRRQAARYGAIIARLPFVRMVAVTGSLALENAEAGDDLDYMIVTEPGRVWVARAFTMAVMRLAALRGVTLCPNYVLSAAALSLPERDLYIARELVQTAPLAGGAVYGQLLAENAWWRDFLPNAEPARMDDAGSPSLPQRAIEAVLRSGLGTLLERRLMVRKVSELQAQAADADDAVFDATMCKGHFEGHHKRTLAAVAERLSRLQVNQP